MFARLGKVGRVGRPGSSSRGPSLDLNFLIGSVDNRITFTRASSAAYFDATGTMQTAGVNVPRLDYGPTPGATPLGLLIEELRTNLLLQSAVLTTQSVAVTAQPYTLSFYDTGTVTLSGAFSGSLIGTGASPIRSSVTFTPTAGALTLTVSGSVLNAQLEAGSFATSYIPTTSAAVNRAADRAIFSSPMFAGKTSSSIVVDGFALQNEASGSNSFWLSLDDNTANNRLTLYTPSVGAQIRTAIWSGGASNMNGVGDVALVRPTLFKAGISADNATAMSYVNGTVGASPTAQAFPLNLTQIQIGTGGVAPVDGYIRRVRYWPRALSAAELTAATT